ncbi:suppressor of fused domain protein [Hamadaea tsunoensis]|uniref:suppressor of fused domain protein n=1 Tax=Hamadaea tsunoensis TaxID=53368 RepID=UPI00041485A2|nr:suppressor of fused domain protein [Hamadaea tsunoensis]
MTNDDFGAPGWEAIDAALEPIYSGVEPRHYGTVIGWRLGGPDPLDGVSAYPRDGHWHFVTYGLSELYAKESDNPDRSGWGFELTFRLAREAAEAEPPMWAVSFLQNLARYVYQSGNVFAAGHHLDLNGPIALSAEDTVIRAVTFTDDPELATIDTSNGRLTFLQVVGITLAEYAAIESWDAPGLLAALAPKLPLFVTDLARPDLAEDPDVAAAIEAGVRRDGSSTGGLYVQEATFAADDAGVRLTFGANAAPRIGRILTARLPFGRGLLVESSTGAVGLQPGDAFAVTPGDDGFLELTVPPRVLDDLVGALRPRAGVYAVSDALTVEIVKSQIRDQDGEVVEEIG